MSASEFQMPRKFTFDEFYEMLKEYVSNPRAQEALAVYDPEYVAGRGNLLDNSQCSEVAHEAYGNFKAIGWSILARHGWPTYAQIIKSSEHDAELRHKVESAGTTFINVARRLIRNEPDGWGWPFQDEDFHIGDPDSVLKLLRMWSAIHPNNLPYVLVGDE